MTYQPLIGYWKYSRKPKFFLFNYIQPSVLINLLALFVFLIPAESGGELLFLVQQQINNGFFRREDHTWNLNDAQHDHLLDDCACAPPNIISR